MCGRPSHGCRTGRRKACQVMSCQVNQWRALQIKTFDKTCEASQRWTIPQKRPPSVHRARAPAQRARWEQGTSADDLAPTSDVARRKTRARDHGGIVTSFSDLPTAHAAAALRHPTQQRTKCRAVVCTLQVQHATSRHSDACSNRRSLLCLCRALPGPSTMPHMYTHPAHPPQV